MALRPASVRAQRPPGECYLLHDLQKQRPDLAIEVVWTSGGISKLEVYRRIGVPEVWIWKDGYLGFWVLGLEGYTEIATSRWIPTLDKGLVAELLSLEFASDVQAALRNHLGL